MGKRGGERKKEGRARKGKREEQKSDRGEERVGEREGVERWHS